MRWIRIALVFFVFALLLAWAPPRAAACSCDPGPEPPIAERGAFIFSGVARQRVPLAPVKARQLVPQISSDPNKNTEVVTNEVVWVFDVDRVFKGRVAAVQGVVTSSYGSSCGLELEVGATYLVFAGPARNIEVPPLNDEEIYAGLCGATQRLGVLGEEQVGQTSAVPPSEDTPRAGAVVPPELGPGAHPLPGERGIPAARVPAAHSSTTSITIPAVGAALMLAALLAHAAMTLSRRRKSA